MVELQNTVEAALEPAASSLNSVGRRLDPRPLVEYTEQRIDFLKLESLTDKSVVDVDVFDAEVVLALSKFAGLLEMTEIATHHPLDGKLIITAFFEASTRTRLSFESAALRLDGKVVSVPDGKVTGIAKGESLADIGEMFNTYGDLVVMRHPKSEAIGEVRRNLTLPLINAGNGTDQHPTQALVDWYTLLKWRPEIGAPAVRGDRRVHIGVVGEPNSMRAVRSFLMMAPFFAASISELTIISPSGAQLEGEIAQRLAAAGIQVSVGRSLTQILPHLDVVYINSIALLADGGYHELARDYRLDAQSRLKRDAVILHPFARRGELDPSLDETAHNLYFAQAASAVFIRQALLICLLGRLAALPGSVLYLAK